MTSLLDTDHITMLQCETGWECATLRARMAQPGPLAALAVFPLRCPARCAEPPPGAQRRPLLLQREDPLRVSRLVVETAVPRGRADVSRERLAHALLRAAPEDRVPDVVHGPPGVGCPSRSLRLTHPAHPSGGVMKGTQFEQFSTEVLRRGAAAVLPQHVPDRWLDALLEEAELFGPGEGEPEENDGEGEGCAGLLGAILVLISAQRGDPPALEIAASTLMEYLNCYILALAAESVSRRTDIWVEPPTLENIFDAEREVRATRRAPTSPSPRPRRPPPQA